MHPDPMKKLPGRGMHLCPETTCIEKACSRPLASRSFGKQTRMPTARQLVEGYCAGLKVQLDSLIVVCRRSGWLKAGTVAVEAALMRGGAAVIFLARDAGQSLYGRITRLSHERDVRCLRVYDKKRLGQLLDGKEVAVVAMTHRGVAKRAVELGNLLEKLLGDGNGGGEQVDMAGHSNKVACCQRG